MAECSSVRVIQTIKFVGTKFALLSIKLDMVKHDMKANILFATFRFKINPIFK